MGIDNIDENSPVKLGRPTISEPALNREGETKQHHKKYVYGCYTKKALQTRAEAAKQTHKKRDRPTKVQQQERARVAALLQEAGLATQSTQRKSARRVNNI